MCVCQCMDRDDLLVHILKNVYILAIITLS